jgi:CRP-like cAMP-binding protein
MAIDDDLRALADVPLFSVFTAEQLRLVAFGTEHLTISKGRELFRAGEAADCGFVIVNGSINMVEDDGMNRRIVHTVGKGTLIGEMALIAPITRPTGAVAAENSEVIRINRSLFRRVLDEYPDLAAQLHGQITARFSTFLQEITRLERKFAD